MDTLPQDWIALAGLVFLLGMKHGFDADHLATIDGLTRFNVRENPRLSRMCGALFSLGHGAVVMCIAVVAGLLAQRWAVPEWMESVGTWISITFLLILGIINLHTVWRAAPGEVVRPQGLRGKMFARLQQTRSPWLVAVVGALFAFSFDTMSQATLFALAAGRFGGWEHGLILAVLFMLGMLLTDGINGFWIARLIRRADAVAVLASRIMGLAVGGLSLLVAGFGMAKYFSAGLDAWSEGKELFFGLFLVGVVIVAYWLATRWVRRPGFA